MAGPSPDATGDRRRADIRPAWFDKASDDGAHQAYKGPSTSTCATVAVVAKTLTAAVRTTSLRCGLVDLSLGRSAPLNRAALAAKGADKQDAIAGRELATGRAVVLSWALQIYRVCGRLIILIAARFRSGRRGFGNG